MDTIKCNFRPNFKHTLNKIAFPDWISGRVALGLLIISYDNLEAGFRAALDQAVAELFENVPIKFSGLNVIFEKL